MTKIVSHFWIVILSFGMASNSIKAQHCQTDNPSPRRMPAEWENHNYTLMSWPAAWTIWGSKLSAVRRDIANLANAIARYERVVMLARPGQIDGARKLLNPSVELYPLWVDDLWARDTSPVFLENSSTHEIFGLNFHFNGWGNKQEHYNDAWVAKTYLKENNIVCKNGPIVGEGGSFELDGEGTLLVTESSVVNSNRNPGMSRDQIENGLKSAFGADKVIWIKGVKGRDITDYHVDCIARFIAPGKVIVGRPGANYDPNDIWTQAADEAKRVLESSTDAKGRKFEIIDLPDPDYNKIRGRGKDFLASYVNFYVANGAVFVSQFGDTEADQNAKEVLKNAFPQRDIVALNTDVISSGGGGIHCATREHP